MFSIHSNLNIVPNNFVHPYPILLNLYVQYTKKKAVRKWLLFEPICAVCIVTLQIVTSNFFRSYPILLTLYVQYTNNPTIKKWLILELICTIYIVTLNIVTSTSTRPNFTNHICSVHQEPFMC